MYLENDIRNFTTSIYIWISRSVLSWIPRNLSKHTEQMLDRPDPGPDRDSADPRTAPSANIMEIMELDEQYDGFGAGDKSKARYGTRNAYRVWVPCIMMGVRSIQSTKGKQTLVIRTLVVVPQLYFSDFLQICFFSFSLFYVIFLPYCQVQYSLVAQQSALRRICVSCWLIATNNTYSPMVGSIKNAHKRSRKSQ